MSSGRCLTRSQGRHDQPGVPEIPRFGALLSLASDQVPGTLRSIALKMNNVGLEMKDVPGAVDPLVLVGADAQLAVEDKGLGFEYTVGNMRTVRMIFTIVRNLRTISAGMGGKAESQP